MTNDRNVKDTVREVNERIRRCLSQVGYAESRAFPLPGKTGNGFINGPSQSQRPADYATNDKLLKQLLVKQLDIIKFQNRLLEKRLHIINNQQLSINDLTAEKDKLLSEIEELKQNQKPTKADSVLVSRPSSPFDSDVEIEAILEKREALRRPDRPTPSHRKYTIKRRLSRIEESPVPVSEPILEPTQKEREVKTHPNSSTGSFPRKTRSSALPNDLVPFRDWTWKRKRLGNDHQKGEIETESGESNAKNGNSVTVANGSEFNGNTPSSPPRTRIHVQEDYISSPDTEFLPSTLFREVGEQEIPKIEPGNIEVPSWRLNRIQPTHQRPTGMEDFDDSAYVKRHWKAEEDEKRRKRWDAQKTRQEQYVEQLKERLAVRAKRRKKFNRGRARKASEDAWDELPGWTPWIESFHPNPKEALFIQITDEIPLNVFGHLLPACTQTEFSLPWTPVSPAMSTKPVASE